MNPLEGLFKALQYPQSVTAGLSGALRRFAPTAEEEEQFRQDGGSALEELAKGFKGGYRPSEAMGIEDDHLGASVADMLLDPLILLGPAAKAGQLGALGKAATTYAPLAKEATLGERAAQGGRRLYEGFKTTGDPLSALGYAGISALGERALPKVAAKLAQRYPNLLGKTGAELAEDAATANNTDPLSDLLNKGPLQLEAGAGQVLRGLPPAPPKPGLRSDFMDPMPAVIKGELPSSTARPPVNAIPMGPVQENIDDPLALLAGGAPVGELPRGAIPAQAAPRARKMGPIGSSRPESMAAVSKPMSQMPEGERPDMFIRQLLETGRNPKGRPLTVRQRELLTWILQNPEAMAQL